MNLSPNEMMANDRFRRWLDDSVDAADAGTPLAPLVASKKPGPSQGVSMSPRSIGQRRRHQEARKAARTTP